MAYGDQHGEELAALEKALLDESVDPAALPFSLLRSITGNFCEGQEIGRGGFGSVYKGVLPSGRTVAVKKLFEKFEILDKNFESEIDCLAGVNHKNTVRLLGYCSDTHQVLRPYEGKRVLADVRQRLLCFEYLPKGCLTDYLSDASCGLHWTTRYQIIKGICEGLHYLHQQHIIHMDLKPPNVLLDDDMVPRIADFGLSRRLSESKSRAITKNMLGTTGYMATEFINKGEITFKTDIYSLGVIIMEILTGHKGCSNVNEVVESWTDTLRISESHTALLEQVKACAKIGIKCTNYYPGNRPATSFIIRGILVEAEISSLFITTDVSTSTEGQVQLLNSKRIEVRKQASFLEKDLRTIKSAATTKEAGNEEGKAKKKQSKPKDAAAVDRSLSPAPAHVPRHHEFNTYNAPQPMMSYNNMAHPRASVCPRSYVYTPYPSPESCYQDYRSPLPPPPLPPLQNRYRLFDDENPNSCSVM